TPCTPYVTSSVEREQTQSGRRTGGDGGVCRGDRRGSNARESRGTGPRQPASKHSRKMASRTAAGAEKFNGGTLRWRRPGEEPGASGTVSHLAGLFLAHQAFQASVARFSSPGLASAGPKSSLVRLFSAAWAARITVGSLSCSISISRGTSDFSSFI